MILRDPDRARHLLAERRRRQGAPGLSHKLTEEWFGEERAFFDDPAQLAASICGRRAGKTRGVCRDLVRDLVTIPGYRGLYINSTRNEAERIAWHGNRNDGMAALVMQHEIPAKLDNTDLTIHYAPTDAWIFLRGADDEQELRKALGGAFHKVYWDEAQKIPPKLGQSIREVFMPTLLDFGGRFRFTGTPSRQMSGLFWDVTRPDQGKRLKGWNVHAWNLLANPYFGRAKLIRGRWFVVWRENDTIVSGPHEEGKLQEAIAGARWTQGVLALQELYGGKDVAPIESPIMQREAFGRWVKEDSAFVYAVHAVPAAELLYAPARVRADGFPDIARALEDLPFDWEDAQFSMGVDIGWYPDPFAFVLWAWHRSDPRLYEVASWRKNYLTSDEQNDAIKAVRAVVNVGLIVADASNPAKPTVKGWSKEWIERYNQPILEAEKAHKHAAIDVMNADIMGKKLALRDDSALPTGGLYAEMSQLQWSSIVSATGRLVEDPTLANDLCLVAGTLVQCEDGEYPIEQVAPGMRAWTRAGLREVTAAWCSGEHPTMTLTHERGTLTGTGAHPIWIDGRWVLLRDVGPGMALTMFGSSPSAVLGVRSTGLVEKVYNLTVDGEPEFFANGALVHNCDSALYGHRHSYQYRFRPEDPKPEPGTPEAYEREEQEIEDGQDDEDEHAAYY